MKALTETTWHSEGGRAALHWGDCLPVLRGMADASVDAVVTDPPSGIGFMGKAWDSNKGGRDQWIDWLHSVMVECLRILKPGGHALVWAIPRTSHWTATACEDAGFEIRDRVSHVFGSGFPKSMDASKAIDKAAGAERPVIGRRTDRAATPKQDIRGGNLMNGVNGGIDCSAITAPATDAAAQWSGWGTALKPAMEDWWLCRKPLAGTVAENLQQHGTGALNVDACRVGTSKSVPASASKTGNKVYGAGMTSLTSGTNTGGFDPNIGRWPAHLTHDGSEDVLSHFPQTQSGKAAEGGHVRNSDKHRNSFAPFAGQRCEGDVLYGDTGSAARFFYCAKASRSDRGAANKHPTVKPTALMRWLCRLITPPNGIIVDPFMGSGSTGKAAILEGFRFVGAEREREYFDEACRRIGKAERIATRKKQRDLFAE